MVAPESRIESGPRITGVRFRGFNEAGAWSPRKVEVEDLKVGSRRSRCFNEAGAWSPRKVSLFHAVGPYWRSLQ